MAGTDGNILLQSDGKLYVNPPGAIVAPMDRNIVTIPQLTVQADSPAAQSAGLEVAYLTRGLSWSADYVARLSPDAATLSLEGSATVTNRTGVDYPNAKVSLMAGSPNRAAVAVPMAEAPAAVAADYDAESRAVARRPRMKTLAGSASEAVGDLHAYHIDKPTTIAQEQMNRLRLLSSDRVPVQRDYSAHLPTLSAWDD